MRLSLIVSIAAMMTLTASAADVSGIWKGTMETPAGPITNTITLKAQGAQVTGSVSLGDYGQGVIANGKLDGDKISFEVTLDQGKLIYEGAVAGDEMKLIVTGTTGNQYNLIAKREK
jgi:hypothetical protein